MEHNNTNQSRVEIMEESLTFSAIYDKEYLPKEYEKDIRNANVLLVPIDFRGINYLFPEGTPEFYAYIQEKSRETEIIPEICISDDKYQELELHSTTITLPEIMTYYVFLPTLTMLLSSYLYDIFKARKESVKACVTINVELDGDSKKVHFEGSIEDFEKAMNAISHNLFKEEE